MSRAGTLEAAPAHAPAAAWRRACDAVGLSENELATLAAMFMDRPWQRT
jgi:hypothetical protein